VSALAVLQLPWWGWILLAAGLIAIVAVLSALFLPDWNEPPELEATFKAAAGSEEFLAALTSFLNVPVVRGGEASILQNGDAFFPAMLEAIRAARETVNFQVYIFEPEGIGAEFIEAFKERARAGVEVRLMVDAFGSHKLDKEHRQALEEAGCKVARFRPLRPWTLVRAFKRDHRRAIVVDGRIGFTGGGAIGEKWTGDAQDPEHWRDSMALVTGSLAAGIQTAFGNNWLYCTGEIISGPRFYPHTGGGPGEAEGGAGGQPGAQPRAGLPAAVALASSPSDSAQPIRLLYWLSLTSARKRILISSSYFVPGRRIRDAVVERARAGVEVRILVPGEKTDAKPVRLAGRSFYEELLAAGVRIFEYRPTMMHAKTVVVDGVWSIVGSSNMDERSTEINEENNLGIADPDLAEQIERGLLADMEQADEIRLDEWRRRSTPQRFKEHFFKLLIEQY
jgi:cardiolipin synthase